MKVRYSVSKNKEGLWVVWKETETKNAISIRGVYSSPSKSECYKYKKKVGVRVCILGEENSMINGVGCIKLIFME